MDLLQQLIDFILHIDKHLADIVNEYHTLTYLILFLIIFAETGFVVTPFLPGDSLLFATGALIAGDKTDLNIWLMFIILTAAAILGNTVNYRLGGWLGAGVFKEKNKILKLKYYHQSHEFFEKHGGKAIIFSRFLPIFRTIAPFVAGIAKMPFGRYTTYNIIGGISWIFSLLFAGFLLGKIPWFKENFDIVVVLIAVVTFLPAIYAAIASRFKTKKITDDIDSNIN